MNKVNKLTFSLFAALAFGGAINSAHADQLDNIKAAGEINVAVFDSNPPFGFIDGKSKQLAGYDIDFARALAKEIGVKLSLKSTNPANRIPLLASGKVDLVVAAFTITDERAKQVDFTVPYFVTGQQFLVPKGKFQSKESLAKARIGAVKGTTGEQAVIAAFPDAKVLSYDEIAVAFAAQRNGNVQVITQDGAILAGLLASAPQKGSYEIPSYKLSVENYGIATRKGESRLLEQVNKALLKLEADGQAKQIYAAWFGPGSATPLPRDFTISAR